MSCCLWISRKLELREAGAAAATGTGAGAGVADQGEETEGAATLAGVTPTGLLDWRVRWTFLGCFPAAEREGKRLSSSEKESDLEEEGEKEYPTEALSFSFSFSFFKRASSNSLCLRASSSWISRKAAWEAEEAAEEEAVQPFLDSGFLSFAMASFFWVSVMSEAMISLKEGPFLCST